jgi:hypothetical protein
MKNIYDLAALALILIYVAPASKTRALIKLLPGRKFIRRILKRWLG